MKHGFPSVIGKLHPLPESECVNRFLFASTARAGRWNHRFIVPAGVVRSDLELARFRDETGPSIAKTARAVTQINGRSGEEMLVLVDDRLKAYPQHLSKIQEQLHQHLAKLGEIVEGEDWNKWPSGPPPVVPCEGLNKLQKDIDDLLTRLVSKRPFMPRWVQRIGGLVVAFVVVAACFLLLPAWNRCAEPAFHQNNGLISKPCNSSQELPGNKQRRFNDLAEKVGFKGQFTDDSCDRLAKQLETKLFGRHRQTDNDSGGKPKRKDGLNKPANPGEQHLSDVMHDFGITVGKETFENWMDPGLDQDLSKLFPAPVHKFSPRGMLELPKCLKPPDNMKPQDLIGLMETLNDLNKKLSFQSEPLRGKYGNFFDHVKDLELKQIRELLKDDQSEIQRRYFVEKDKAYLKVLSNLLNAETAKHLYLTNGQDEDATHGISEGLNAISNAWDKKSGLLSEGILNSQKENFQDDSNTVACFELLATFVKECNRVATESRDLQTLENN